MTIILSPETQEVVLSALRVSGLGLVGIFVFMTFFWLLIVSLNYFLPAKASPQAPEISPEAPPEVSED